MPTEREEYMYDVCNSIKARIKTAETRISVTKESISLKEQWNKDLQNIDLNIKIAKSTSTYVKRVRQVTKDHIAEKENKGVGNINSGIEAVRAIIPDTPYMKFDIRDDGASIITKEEWDVDDVEGSALRAMLSAIVRNISLLNTNYINFMLLDEPFSTLSPETSAKLSPYLSILSKNCLIILTEQKKEIFVDGKETSWEFEKTGDISTIRKCN